MRSLLVAYAALALIVTTSGCGEGNDPDEIPRTVPPTSVPSAAPDQPPIDDAIVEA
jgi:hypothetical protein